MSNGEYPVIGRVAATKLAGNNSREFFFWISPETRINPLDLIEVKEQVDSQSGPVQRSVYAQVLDITSYTDAESFLEVFASTNFGDVALTSDVDRIACNVAKAQVLGTSDEDRMPVQFNSKVYLADAKAIMALLRVDELSENNVTVGYIEQSNKVKVPVKMDVTFLTGPDGAHLNVSGKSRLATKTSYILCLLSSILQSQDDTAVIMFNVKGSDLLQIHEPNRLLAAERDLANLSDLDLRRLEDLKGTWKSMGLEAIPFENVHYFLPSQRTSPSSVNSDLRNLPNSDARITEQPSNYHVYRYVLADVRDRLNLLFSSINVTEPQEQFITAMSNDTTSPVHTKHTFQDLSTELSAIAKKGQNYLNSMPGPIRVVSRMLDDIVHNKTTGVFDYERQSLASGRHHLPSTFIRDELQAGDIAVIDIARVNDTEQQWIFGDVLRAVEDLMAFGGRGKLKKVIIFVDELNKYAPSGYSSPLSRDIVDITARGGSLGVILLGAEQFASKINTQVYGNCANKAFGLTDATEASTDPYRSFPREIRDGLSELRRGELIINFDFFGQPLRIKFPPPACRKQEDATQP